MAKIRTLLFVPFLSLLVFVSCDQIDLGDLVTDPNIAEGLKEALNVGTDTAVSNGSKFNGYFGNPEIKIPFPEEADVVLTVVGAIPGGDALIDDFVESLNRAAEDAANKATPILKDAILEITFDDAVAILDGADTAATNYLRIHTFDDLYSAFKPDIQTSLESVGAQAAWEAVMDLYNSIPFVEDVNTDLADYATTRGLDGLFVLVGHEEEKIRNDVNHQVTDLLQEIFGH